MYLKYKVLRVYRFVILYFIHSFCSLGIQKVRSLTQSEFFTECNLVFPLPIYSILSFP
jgi:hypothetical protein